MNKEALINCPFCNTTPSIESKFTGRKGVLTIVKCPKCRAQRVDRGLRSSIVEMEDRAVRQWNTQYAQSQTEALKKEIDRLYKVELYRYSHGHEAYSIIYLIDGKIKLYSIPMYGGEEIEEHIDYKDLQDLIEKIQQFT